MLFFQFYPTELNVHNWRNYELATLTYMEAPDNMIARVKSRTVGDILVISHFGIYTLILKYTLSTFVNYIQCCDGNSSHSNLVTMDHMFILRYYGNHIILEIITIQMQQY